jgi:hypothetical protein
MEKSITGFVLTKDDMATVMAASCSQQHFFRRKGLFNSMWMSRKKNNTVQANHS